MMMSGSRITQQLREYNPRQFGICSFNATRNCCFYCKRAPPPAPPRLPCRFPLGFGHASSSKKFLSSYSSSSSSSFTNNSDDLARVSLVNNDNCAQDTSQAPVLSNCLSPAENGEDPPFEGVSVAGGVVALGKFDALHIGHRELVIQAARIGVPFLMSFVGMAEVFGWEPRAPIVAKCDRKRVLSSWAPLCGNMVPKELEIEFSKVRCLTPQQFVAKLSEELGIRGVVAGQNYRFGYKAAGNASDLVRLCKEYNMSACIINTVMDKSQESKHINSTNSKEQGQVSSTRVRHALSNGDMKYVSELLGRPHRLILKVRNTKTLFRDRKRLSAPRSCLLNLPPREGSYRNCSLVIGDDEHLVPCRVVIDTTDIHLELDEYINITAQNLELLGIDFGDSKVQ